MRHSIGQKLKTNLHVQCLLISGAVITFSGLLCGCSEQPAANQAMPAGKINVVVTTGMVGDLVRHVGREHVEVIGLMGEGVDPHLFRPTPSDNGKLMNADLIIYSGLMLEGPMQAAFEQAKKRGKTVVAVTAGLPKDKILYPEGFGDHPDPHVWGNISLWADCLETVVAVLSDKAPEHAQEFTVNAAAYRAEMRQVDAYAKAAIASIPEERRYLVTAHDAFEYFATAYGIQVRSVQGISTDSDPGVQDINTLVDFLVDHKIPAIFIEATVNAGSIRAVIEGAQQKDWEVKIGGTLYSDSLGTPGTYTGTYLGMMDSNITTIASALGGDVPAGGLRGNLKPTPK